MNHKYRTFAHAGLDRDAAALLLQEHAGEVKPHPRALGGAHKVVDNQVKTLEDGGWFPPGDADTVIGDVEADIADTGLNSDADSGVSGAVFDGVVEHVE